MKCPRSMMLWLLCAILVSGFTRVIPSSKAASVTRPDILPKGYVRLSDWASANGFELRWLKFGESFQLANRSWRLLLYKDSREAEFGGVRVCLSYPILIRNGAGYIAQVDLDTALRPLLAPSRGPKRPGIWSIVIDPGHGGKDPGNVVGPQQEKKYTLLLAQQLSEELKRAGFSVSFTRSSDVFVPLPDRPILARKRGADLFISLHWNELPGNRDMKGAQTFCLTPGGASSSNAGGHSLIGAGPSVGNRNNAQNMLLAYSIQKSLLGNVGVADRGVRRARYWVLRDATMPAVLIEGGFMSNPNESRRIYDANYRQQMARAIAQGVIAYKKQVQ